MIGKCKICGEYFKNLGAHMFQGHKNMSTSADLRFEDEVPSDTSGIQVDEVIREKPLSVLVSEIKDLLRPYQSEITVRIVEKGSRMKEIEITARIQL